MKILMLCDFFSIDQQYQENLVAKYYTKLGHDVHIIANTCKDLFQYLRDDWDHSIPSYSESYAYGTVYRLKYRFKYKNLIKIFENIKPIVESIQPDLIYSHNLSLNIHQTIAYLDSHPKSRMIIDFHIDYSNIGQSWKAKHLLHGFLRKSYFQYYLKYFKIIYPIVPGGLAFLHAIYGAPMNKMKVLPLGYDEDEVEVIKRSTDRRQMRESLNIAEGDFLIVTGGKFTKEKRTELLLEAVNTIGDKQVHVAIFGKAGKDDEDYLRTLKGLANERTHFLGWLSPEEIMKYLFSADMAVYPASQSVLWQQSIGMGLPLVLGDVGGQDPSYLNLYNNIVILHAADITVSNIADAINRIKQNPDIREAMKKGAEKTAEEYLRYSAICQTTLSDAFS